jgi:hypothetical protein
MSEPRILIRLLRIYFPWNWEFGSALSKLRNFGTGGVEPPPPTVRPDIYCSFFSAGFIATFVGSLSGLFFNFSVYLNVLSSHRRWKCGDRGNCFVPFDSPMTWRAMTRTRTCSVFWAVTACWTVTADVQYSAWHSWYAVRQEISRCYGTISFITEFLLEAISLLK